MNSKRVIVYSCLGGLLLFLWQFISNAAMDFHEDFHVQTQHQDKILHLLDSLDLEEGSYMMPMYPKDFSSQEIEAYMKNRAGKPWAIVQYHKNWKNDMLTPLLGGFLIDILVAFFLIYVTSLIKDITLLKSVMVSLIFGLSGFFTINYLNFLWYETPDIWAWLLDGTIPWMGLGVFGFWVTSKN